MSTCQVIMTRLSVSPFVGTIKLATRKSGTSTSLTFRLAEPLLKPDAVAVIVTGFIPSETPSMVPAIVKFTKAWPAGIVTRAGTCASPGALFESVTNSAPLVAVLRVTLPVTRLPSATRSLDNESVNVGPSLSRTWSGTVPALVSRISP